MNISQSVATSQTNSKATKERKTRQASYKAKFNRPHMIIPQEDFEWVRDKPNSVKTLLIDCWLADPYGSHFMQLNHSLKPSSFKKAKKIIADAGLFIFESKRSQRDARESVCWQIRNLHGARRNDFWLNSEKLKASKLAHENNSAANKANHLPIEANQLTSIAPQTHTQHELQNPSETSQERLSNSPKELLETLAKKKGVDLDSSDDRYSPLEGAIASVEPQTEKKEESFSALPTEQEIPTQADPPSYPEDPQALNKTSTAHNERLDEQYKFDWRTTEAAERAAAQNKAILASKDSEEYQSASRAAFARIRGNFEGQAKNRQADRISRLRGDRPMVSAEIAALEEYRQELEGRKFLLVRPAPEDYDDDW